MTQIIHARMTASITELKKSPMDTILSGQGEAVAILNRNTPAFYCIPAELYENMLEQLDDIELNKIADSRLSQKRIQVDLNDL
ncbi:plasmid stabilization protein [Acinetobacter sp. B5B]|jgi:antitoxin StbD|uniref:type II toxin-antitoxin system Phd/YefM family antitoxin n=1 Tax=Acinetobacter baretiae TaxID=2605383 RepID=UPI0018C3176C|nr:plasmid stabilization protein [Acinetobacter baretiae]MBF7684069.1 plasmid stabilization protein [Acinetobacter baretiae]MBF7686248.1 plasmid stabilization protein [Acinetobacter baretiae]